MVVVNHEGLRIVAADALARGVDRLSLVAEALRLIDAASAEATLHWGRNYLYTATLRLGPTVVPVVVKQWKPPHRLRLWLRAPSKAARAFANAQALLERGINTPEPLLMVEARSGGASHYVCRLLPGASEARHLLRGLNEGTAGAAGAAGESCPRYDPLAVVAALGALARRLHDRGVWYRDLTSGNVLLVPPSGGAAAQPELYLVDTNRARVLGRVGLWRRARDLSRMPVLLAAHQRRYLEGYCGGPPPLSLRLLYRALHRSFLWRNRGKRSVRGVGRRVADALLPRRRAHLHLPPPPSGAALRDRVVWDRLSDQPHQHARRSERLWVRLLDAPHHLEALLVAQRALRRARPRLRELRARAFSFPVPLDGIGVAVRPQGGDPARVVELIRGLGVRQVLLRLEPWQERHDDELQLARALAAAGCELAVSLPQNRELVTDPERWRASVARLGRAFAPLVSGVQIGQAPNRSRWGIWHPGEYGALFDAAARELRAVRRDLPLFGPAVIDFEVYATAALLNLERAGEASGPAPFDGVASLLYVDRRGAPENRQLGLDTTDKAALIKALAETAERCTSGRSWITEFNWPLREGPHSPAGREVAVSEEQQANYLVRYYLATLGSGLVERAYWWQLIAKGYGLVDPEGLRRRPAYHALRTLAGELAGATVLGRCALPDPARGVRFAGPRGEIWVVWSRRDRPIEIELPRPADFVTTCLGEPAATTARRLVVTGAPRYLRFGHPP